MFQGKNQFVSAVSGPSANVNMVTAEDDYCCQNTRFKAKNFEVLVPGAINVNNFQFLPEELKRLTEDIILPLSKTKVDRADESIVDNQRLFLNDFKLERQKGIHRSWKIW
jgi:hypothetical protein